ncbi:MAG TPA: allantoinase AllB [Bacteroidota bacterium]
MNLLALSSARIITPTGTVGGVVVLDNDHIHSVGSFNDLPSGIRHIEYGTDAILPGLVDSHVHVNEPGRTEWEGFSTATRAAAAGGVTTIIDMPLNSSPVTTTVEALEVKRTAAKKQLWVDCGFYAGVVPGSDQHLVALTSQGIRGAKAFLVHSGIEEFPAVGEMKLRAALPILQKAGLPLLVHAELASSIRAGISSARSYSAYVRSRPPEWETDAIKLLLSLCEEFRSHIHIVHLSARESLPILQEAKQNGLPVTTETCPHYLLYSEEDIPDGDTRFKCAPPIRSREHKESLWEGLLDGTVDLVVSDHSPSPPSMKFLDEGDFVKAWGGISSIQFGLPAVWTEAANRGATLNNMVDWMSTQPAKLAGISTRKGAIAPGMDADLVVFDPDGETLVSSTNILHRHKVTPYEGKLLRGKVRATYLRGKAVYENGIFEKTARGILV